MSKRCNPPRGRRSDIRAFLDVCSGHLSPETWAWLDVQTTDDMVRDPDNRLATEILGGRTRYGWFVYAHEQPTEPVPADLVAVMQLARGLRCDYVRFDCDAPLTPNLQVLHPSFQNDAAAVCSGDRTRTQRAVGQQRRGDSHAEQAADHAQLGAGGTRHPP